MTSSAPGWSYSAIGEKDRAVALLEVAYKGRTGRLSLLNVDPRFDGLRDDPRFEALLRRMGFPGQERPGGPPWTHRQTRHILRSMPALTSRHDRTAPGR